MHPPKGKNRNKKSWFLKKKRTHQKIRIRPYKQHCIHKRILISTWSVIPWISIEMQTIICHLNDSNRIIMIAILITTLCFLLVLDGIAKVKSGDIQTLGNWELVFLSTSNSWNLWCASLFGSLCSASQHISSISMDLKAIIFKADFNTYSLPSH